MNEITIAACIQEVDALEPNAFDEAEKLRWLNRLDGRVYRDIIRTHEKPAVEHFEGYGEDTPTDTVLLIREPYGDVYTHWLRAQIALYNGENGRYNDAMAAFEDAWNRFTGDYTRDHRPKRVGRFRF